MTKTKDNKPSDDVIMCTDEAGMQLYLSEKAANRLSWILTGVMILISMPVIILAFMMI
jgi:CHASE3 domain sensor protein